MSHDLLNAFKTSVVYSIAIMSYAVVFGGNSTTRTAYLNIQKTLKLTTTPLLWLRCFGVFLRLSKGMPE